MIAGWTVRSVVTVPLRLTLNFLVWTASRLLETDPGELPCWPHEVDRP